MTTWSLWMGNMRKIEISDNRILDAAIEEQIKKLLEDYKATLDYLIK